MPYDNADNVPMPPNTDFSKIRVGIKTLDDATVNLGTYKRINPNFGDKQYVLKTINSGNLDRMRQISQFYYRTNGIYNRLCRYLAYLYRYDWLITPYINGGSGLIDEEELKDKERIKITDTFFKALKFFDDFEVKKFFGNAALQVIRQGSYYGYIIPNGTSITVQELPAKYSRARYSVNGRPAVEFNMKFFDDFYSDPTQRSKILNLFPADFKRR